MIRQGDIVEILAEFRDAGDEEFTWVALNHKEKGRVDIQPVDHPFDIKPVSTVRADQIRVISAGPISGS